MSLQVIKIIHKHNGFCNIFVDGKMVGIVEDPEEFAVRAMITNMMKAMGLEVEIVTEKEK